MRPRAGEASPAGRGPPAEKGQGIWKPMGDFAAVNAVYGRCLEGDDAPARPAKDALVEIDCAALVD